MAKIEVYSFIMCSLIFLGTLVQTLPVEDLDLEIMTRLESEGNTLDSDATATSELLGWGWGKAMMRKAKTMYSLSLAVTFVYPGKKKLTTVCFKFYSTCRA